LLRTPEVTWQQNFKEAVGLSSTLHIKSITLHSKG